MLEYINPILTLVGLVVSAVRNYLSPSMETSEDKAIDWKWIIFMFSASTAISLPCLIVQYVKIKILKTTSSIPYLFFILGHLVPSLTSLILLLCDYPSLSKWAPFFSQFQLTVTMSAIFQISNELVYSRILYLESIVVIASLNAICQLSRTEVIKNIFNIIAWTFLVIYWITLFSRKEMRTCNSKIMYIFIYWTYALVVGIVQTILTLKQAWYSVFNYAVVSIIQSCFLFTISSVKLFYLMRNTRLLQEQKSHVVRYISHEVRTPLNILSSGLDILKTDLSKGVSSEQIQQHLSDMQTSLVIAVDGMTDLLNYESINEKKFDVNLHKVSIKRILSTESINMFMMFASSKSIQFTFDQVDSFEGENIMCDEGKLNAVIRNLVTNAIKFTPPNGKICLQSKIITDNGSRYLQVRIVDSGNGMTNSQVKSLFKEFQKFSESSSSIQGNGIGLFMSKIIIDMHSGTIEAFSDGIGQGSTFTVKIPLIKLNVVPSDSIFFHSRVGVEPPSSEHYSIDILPTTSQKIYILIVDDSTVNCQIQKRLILDIFANENFLKSFDISVTMAYDGTTAIEENNHLFSTKNRYFDFIFLDNLMISKHGPETAKEIKSLSSFNGYIVGITGNAMKDQVDLFLASGADNVLIKPVDKKKLKKTIIGRLTDYN